MLTNSFSVKYVEKKIFLFVFFNTIKTFFAFRMTLVFDIVINLPEGAWILKWEVAPVGYFQVIIVILKDKTMG